MPYLPPTAPPMPRSTAPPVFDAKTLVDATKRKVENPAYGHMPTGTPEGRAAADAARARMRQKRRRNKILAWVMAIGFLVVLCGAGYALYTMYQDDQDGAGRGEARRRGKTPLAARLTSPVGDRQVAEGARRRQLRSDARPAGCGAAVEDAKQAVGQANGQSLAGRTLALADVLPPGITAVATELQPLDGLTRYMIKVDDAVRADPTGTPGWLARLKALPQAPELSQGLTLVPAVGPGEIAIALAD